MRVGRIFVELLGGQFPVIDSAATLLVVIAVLLFLLFVFLVVMGWPVWHLIARPIAVAYGVIPMTGYDYVVRGWKAERQGQWAEALKAYNLSISNFPHYAEAHQRRDALLAAYPQLIADATPPSTPEPATPRASRGRSGRT